MRKYNNIKQFSCQGNDITVYHIMVCACMDLHIATEKNNDNCKKTYHRNSNKWYASRDILRNMYMENALSVKAREKRGYE